MNYSKSAPSNKIAVGFITTGTLMHPIIAVVIAQQGFQAYF